MLSLIKSDSSAILERMVRSCALLSPDAEGKGVSPMMVFGEGEGSVSVRVRFAQTAWNMSIAKQMSPKPTKTCCRAAAPRWTETWAVGAFGSNIFIEWKVGQDCDIFLVSAARGNTPRRK